MATTKSSIELSIPKARKARGYTVDRMPIGRFLSAARIIQNAPEEILRGLFPETEGSDALKQLARLNREGLQALFLRAVGILPGYAVRLFAELSGIDEERLLNDPAIGLDGLAELVDAWLEVNGIENFIRTAGALEVKVRGLMTKGGSNA